MEYDGTDFAGFQRQRDQPTVQGELEKALAEVVGPTATVAAGRTDAGVHAIGQVVSFTTEKVVPWVRALNAHLPASIAVIRAVEVPNTFHARYSATSRAYRYTILNRAARAPLTRARAWHVPQPLDADAMNAAAQSLLGTHDFAAFAGKSDRTNTVRTLLSIAALRSSDVVNVEMEANAFLPHMVRNVVGTLVEIGKGCLDASELVTILASCDRSRAAATAPPHGLCFVRVRYGDAPI